MFKVSLLSGAPRALSGFELIICLPDIQHRDAQTVGFAFASRRNTTHDETGHDREGDGLNATSRECRYCMLPLTLFQEVKQREQPPGLRRRRAPRNRVLYPCAKYDELA